MSEPRDIRNEGPLCYENWIAASQDKPLQWTVEYPLFSDAYIVGELTTDCGPYKLLNTVAFAYGKESILRPVMVLRVDEYDDYTKPGGMERTVTHNYHAGSLCDEIAALISLELGIRLKAGEVSRRFFPGGDSRGQPQALGFSDVPSLSRNRRGRILPKIIGERPVQNLTLLRQLPELSLSDAATLIRSARMCQEAVWVAESQPELAWILLVSAIEVAATHYLTEAAPVETLIEMMQASEPKLVEVLRKSGGDALVAKAAEAMRSRLAATRKFRDFIIEFCPPPPEGRPVSIGQTVWKDDNLEAFRNSLGKIYKYRSQALHSGIPFPLPMCEPPYYDAGTFWEIPTGLATNRWC